MSYDLIFLRRQPGQSWDETLEALEEADDEAIASAPAAWSELVERVRQVQPEIVVSDDQLSDEELSIIISCSADEANVSVPYWYEGEKARADLSTADGIFHIHDAVDIFDGVARTLGETL